MSLLRKKLIRLAYADETLRPHLLPLLKNAAYSSPISETFAQARDFAKRGKRWRLYLSFIEGSSAKYWEAQNYDQGTEGQVLVRWGRVGSKGRTAVQDWAYVAKVYPGKLRKGYSPSNPFEDRDKLRALKNLKNVGAVPPEHLQIISRWASVVLKEAERLYALAVEEFPVQVRSLTRFGNTHNIQVDDLLDLLKIAQVQWYRGMRKQIDGKRKTLRGLNLKLAKQTSSPKKKTADRRFDVDSLWLDLFSNQYISEDTWAYVREPQAMPKSLTTRFNQIGDFGGPSLSLADQVKQELEFYLPADPYLALSIVLNKRLKEHGFKI